MYIYVHIHIILLPRECGQLLSGDLCFDLLLLVSFHLIDQGCEVGLLEFCKGVCP